VTGYGLDDEVVGSSSPGRVQNFLSSTSFRPALGSTQPPTQWVPGALFPDVKQQEREADHSSPTSVEVKQMWIYKSTPPIHLHGVVLNSLSTGTTLTFFIIKNDAINIFGGVHSYPRN
jgi:hypothetical protein